MATSNGRKGGFAHHSVPIAIPIILTVLGTGLLVAERAGVLPQDEGSWWWWTKRGGLLLAAVAGALLAAYVGGALGFLMTRVVGKPECAAGRALEVGGWIGIAVYAVILVGWLAV